MTPMPSDLVGGRHGGLHEREMLVPFFALKLGASMTTGLIRFSTRVSRRMIPALSLWICSEYD